MGENKLYLAVGEESVRGTGEVTTVGFIPCLDPFIPTSEFDERARADYRGEVSQNGDTENIRFSGKWAGSINMPMFTEAGTTAGMVGTLFRHFFGSSTSAQNASTGQYYHMMYRVGDPFSSANLDTKALTLNANINEEAVMKNWPYLGGRVGSLTFTQEPGQHLAVALGVFGQKRDTTTAELGSETFAAENLRCDYNNLTMYTSTITRVGTGPDYTDFTFGSATQLCPDSMTLSVESNNEDVLRLCGKDYPDKTRKGKFKVTLEFTIDWEDPASGFSSVDEFNLWIASASNTNFFLHFDTGTQAGTGDNHSLYIDIPKAQRVLNGVPEYDLDTDPMITMRYEGLVDATTTYILGLMLKNTSATV